VAELGPARAAGSGFALPASTTSCAAYDDWWYGLQSRNTYTNALPASLVRQNLVMRDVILVLGAADTFTADLVESCAADLQGPRRYY